MESVEYESAWVFGAHCGNDDIGAVAFLIDQCNDLGMDTIEMGNVLATYMEISQRGWDGAVPLSWGDSAKMVELVKKTALRQDIGDVFAEGVVRLATHFGAILQPACRRKTRQ